MAHLSTLAWKRMACFSQHLRWFRKAQSCCSMRLKAFAFSLLTVLAVAIIERTNSLGQDSTGSTSSQDPIAQGILHSYITSLPEGMFFGNWQIMHGSRSNIENPKIMSMNSSEASGEWKFAPRKFDWFRGQASPEMTHIVLRDPIRLRQFESKQFKDGKVYKSGTIVRSKIDPFDFHVYRMWWPLMVIDVFEDSSFGNLNRVEVKDDRTFIHFQVGSAKAGFFELDLRDGFQVMRVFEECVNPRFGDFSHDWTFENQPIQADGKKYWFPKSSRFFFHNRTAGQNKKKELIAEFSDVGYSSIIIRPEVEFPDGTTVHDTIEGTQYRVGGDKVPVANIEEIERLMSRSDMETLPNVRSESSSSKLATVAWWGTATIALIAGCAFGMYRFRRRIK